MAPSRGKPASSWSDRASFVATRWTVVLAAAGERSSTQRRRALEELAETYWFPLYAYVRRRGHNAAEAEDLTQEFFARLLEKKSLAMADRDKGKFRTFLLAALKNFLANEWDKGRTEKRGRGKPLVALDAVDAETRYRLAPADELTPERLFERRWALTLLDLVVSQLRQKCVSEGKERLFDRLKGFLAGATAGAPYSQAAADLDMTEAAVKMAVHRLRRQFRRLLRAQIAHTVASPEEIDDEIRHLFEALED